MTCGLRISETPTSDNLNPQETMKAEAPDMGLDGARLSCPGSSVVAKSESDTRPVWFRSLGSAEDTSQRAVGMDARDMVYSNTVIHREGATNVEVSRAVWQRDDG
jgi:hypothetical protein